MPNIQTPTHYLTVRHFPAGKLQLTIDMVVLAELNRNDAMILSSMLEQVAYELPFEDDEVRL